MDPGPIAVFDSGEGGLTVLRHLVDRFPREQFVYAADSNHFPYGEKSLAEVRQWFLQFVEFFQEQGARAVVIACNTATAAALDAARARFNFPIIGVVEAAVRRAALTTANRRVGVLSTEATYRSGLYPTALAALDPGIQVVSKPCPILVQMAENGDTDGAHVEDEVRQCVAPVLAQKVDTIILGCTHFPHMRDVFNRVVGESIHIVDPGEVIADYLSLDVEMAKGPASSRPVMAWTSGDAAQFASVTAKLCPRIPMVTRRLRWRNGQLTH